MSCSKCKTIVVKRSDSNPNTLLVRCKNCLEPLETVSGLRQPVQVLFVRVSQADVTLWQSLGYELEIEKV